MHRILASVAILALVSGCSASAVQKVEQAVNGAASIAQAVCTNVVPSLETAATAAAGLLNNPTAATQVSSTITNYITPACSTEAKIAGSVSSGWLNGVLANLVTTATTGAAGTAPTGQTGS